ETMYKTLSLASTHGVEIGAHPAYPDLVGFGRRSMKCTDNELKALIWYQIGALAGVARPLNLSVSYVKPHGALYNDMMRSQHLLSLVMTAVKEYDAGLKVMIPVTLDHQAHAKLAATIGIEVVLEAFADRAYDDTGRLVPRDTLGAVHHDPYKIVEQARSFATLGGLHSVSGRWLDLPAQSLCVHGDNAESVQAVASIRAALQAAEDAQ
ncbi:MAG: 5-oxoprolinase subunit PxpA, partial [Natronospirillum sp.]